MTPYLIAAGVFAATCLLAWAMFSAAPIPVAAPETPPGRHRAAGLDDATATVTPLPARPMRPQP